MGRDEQRARRNVEAAPRPPVAKEAVPDASCEDANGPVDNKFEETDVAPKPTNSRLMCPRPRSTNWVKKAIVK